MENIMVMINSISRRGWMAWIDRGKSGSRVRSEARIISMKAHLWCMETIKLNFLIIGLIERLPPAERLTSSLAGASPLDFPNVIGPNGTNCDDETSHLEGV